MGLIIEMLFFDGPHLRFVAERLSESECGENLNLAQDHWLYSRANYLKMNLASEEL